MPDRPSLFASNSMTSDGECTTTVEFGQDTVLALDRDAAVRYALAVMQACRYAEYDAAVWAQLAGEVKMERHLAAFVIKELRADRPPLDTEATAPFGFEPVFSHVTGDPAVMVSVGGTKTGTITTRAGLQHAMNVLIGSSLVDVDQVYLKLLRSSGIDERAALAFVSQLRRFGRWQQDDIDG